MVAKRSSPPELSYDEQVAIARANLDRDIADFLAKRARLRESGVDVEAEFEAWLREAFTWEALCQAYQEFRRNPSDWLDELPSGECEESDEGANAR